MPQGHNTPSLYEMLTGHFTGGLPLSQVSEQNQVILSVLDNMQRILNCRAGTLAHLPDYGLPDMTKILQGMPGTAHQLLKTLSDVLLKYEPRLKKITVVLLEQNVPGELRYAIDAGKIERELGWRPQETFESGIRKTVEWYLANTQWVENVKSGSYKSWIEENYGDRV